MSATSKQPDTHKESHITPRQGRFFASRGWETTCGGPLQNDENPDRWVFLVSLILLPVMWIL